MARIRGVVAGVVPGVVPAVQGMATDAQVELQPAGLGVKGHLLFENGEVGGCCHLAVELHVTDVERERMGERKQSQHSGLVSLKA